MDTVIKNINLHGKTVEMNLSDIEDWINDAANKLNLMLNGPVRDDTEQDEESIGKTLKDSVIATGETTKGTCKGTIGDSKCFYRKWKSGVLEIWGYRMSNNIIFQESPWGGYESRVDTGTELLTRIGVWGTWPVPFVDEPHVDYKVSVCGDTELSGDYEIIHHQRTTLKKQSPEFKLWRGTERTIHNPVVTFRAIGHWM